MKLVQCWDDGVTTDVRLVSLLRRHGARVSFNLNAGLHASQRQLGWHHFGTEVWRLGRDELRGVYDGFSIANHTLTHPHLEQLPIEVARREISDGRACLQALFDQPVSGFVYPFGTFDNAVAQAVRDAGHLYARITRAAASASRPATPWPLPQAATFWRPISGSVSIKVGRERLLAAGSFRAANGGTNGPKSRDGQDFVRNTIDRIKTPRARSATSTRHWTTPGAT